MPLAERFIVQFAGKYHRPVSGLDDSARLALESYRWSGNIRELQNVIEKAVILSDPPVILSEAKNLSAKDLQIDPSGSALRMTGSTGTLRAVSEKEEERLVREAVERTGGNISAAAKALGVSRPTLYAKMKKYGL